MTSIDVLESFGSIDTKYIDEALNAKPVNRKLNLITAGFLTLAASFIIFVAAINLFPQAALAINDIVGIGDLVKIMTFDKSMRACLENEYAQYVGDEFITNEGIKAKVYYLITDAGRISIFFNSGISNSDTISFDAKAFDIYSEELETVSSLYETELDNFYEYRIDFAGSDIPSEFLFKINYFNIIESTDSDSEEITEELGFAEFRLKPDPYYSEIVKSIDVYEDITVLNQKIKIERLNIYPTQTEVVINSSEDNTNIIKSIQAVLIDDKGYEYTSKLGLSGTFDEVDQLKSIWFESPYFSDAKELTVKITAISMLDKKNTECEILYDNKFISNLPDCISVDKMNLTDDNNLEIDFSWQTDDFSIMNPILAMYADTNTIYDDYCEYGMSTDENERAWCNLILKDYEAGKYKLQLIDNVSSELDNPVYIKINIEK